MDELRIVTKFTRGIISKIVASTLKKKTGYDIDISLNELNVTVTDGKAHVHLSTDVELDIAELKKILKTAGID